MKRLFWAGLLAVALCAPGSLLAESAPKPLALMDAAALSAEEARTAADATDALETRLEKRLRKALKEPFFNGDAFYLGSAGVVFVARVPFVLNGDAADLSGDLWDEARRDLTDGFNKSAEKTALLKSALTEAVQNADWDVKSLGPIAAAAVGKGHSILTVRRSEDVEEVSVQFQTLKDSPALEDAAVMARILEKTAGADNSVHNIRGVPIEGYGVLFLADAKLPLSAPPQTDTAQTTLDPGTLEAQRRFSELGNLWRDFWEENLPHDLAVRPLFPRLEEFPELDIDFEPFLLRQDDFMRLPPELEARINALAKKLGSSRFHMDGALPFALPSPYDAGKAEALTTRLMEALKHGARLRLEPTETVAVAVLGAPTYETTTETHDRSEDGVQYRSSMTILSGHALTDTFMAFRVSKDSINRFAAGELTLEALRNEARVVTGIE